MPGDGIRIELAELGALVLRGLNPGLQFGQFYPSDHPQVNSCAVRGVPIP